ncbi:MAG: glutamate 5-kinase [Acidobacteriota bacterium]|nr:glutamate 5-kinase [Acidobacteriota bacterium]
MLTEEGPKDLSKQERRSAVRRVVVKVGTSVVTRADGGFGAERVAHLIDEIAAVRRGGVEVLLVSSGAIGIGRERLGLTELPTSVVDRQACAAAGQGALMAFYDGLCMGVGLSVAQVLLTEADFRDRRRYLNLAATLQRLLELGALPIINENDTVSTDEIVLRGAAVFGDNDRLSALVAANLGADLLIMLSDVDGVYDAPPDMRGAKRIGLYSGNVVDFGEGSGTGRGGMEAKIAAAQVAANSGVKVIIASGLKPHPLTDVVVEGRDRGTTFPASNSLNKRRHWLAYATVPAGTLVVNDGARDALVSRQASLLPRGISAVRGSFAAGAVVSVVDAQEVEIARGICRESSNAIPDLIDQSGRARALVHRDQIAILIEE